MSVLVGNDTKLAVAGITGREGSFHTLNNRRYGTNVVGGINPKKAGENVEGIPVFADWATTVAETGANTAMIFVPPPFAAASALEAAAAGVEVVIIITEGIPAHDELKLYNQVRRDYPGTTLVGPNCRASSRRARRTSASSRRPSSRRATSGSSRAPAR